MLASYIIALHGALLRFWAGIHHQHSIRFFTVISLAMAQPTVHRGSCLLDLVLRLLLNQRMQQGVKPVFLFRVGEDSARARPGAAMFHQQQSC